MILGGGVSGTHAARMAMGIEASVTVIDKSLRRLRELNTQYGARLQTLFATVQIIEREVRAADLVIGAVLVPGAAAPKLVRRETVRQMKRGAAIVDISIDQGRLFRDQPSDDLCRTDLRNRRRHPLLRHQYAGSCGENLDLRSQQRHSAVRARLGQPRLEARTR